MSSGRDHHDAGVARRPLLAAAATATGLAWTGARGGVLMLGVAAVLGGVAPVLVAWLTRAVLDGIGGGTPVSELVALGAALALTGVVSALLPQLEQYLRAEVDRSASRLGSSACTPPSTGSSGSAGSRIRTSWTGSGSPGTRSARPPRSSRPRWPSLAACWCWPVSWCRC